MVKEFEEYCLTVFDIHVDEKKYIKKCIMVFKMLKRIFELRNFLDALRVLKYYLLDLPSNTPKKTLYSILFQLTNFQVPISMSSHMLKKNLPIHSFLPLSLSLSPPLSPTFLLLLKTSSMFLTNY